MAALGWGREGCSLLPCGGPPDKGQIGKGEGAGLTRGCGRRSADPAARLSEFLTAVQADKPANAGRFPALPFGGGGGSGPPPASQSSVNFTGGHIRATKGCKKPWVGPRGMVLACLTRERRSVKIAIPAKAERASAGTNREGTPITRYWIGAVAGAWAFVMAGPAQAGPVTFEYTGTVSFVYDGLGTLPSSIAPGAAFELSYTLDSTTPDAFPGNSNAGHFSQSSGVFINFTVAIAGIEFILDSTATDGFVDIIDHAYYDQFVARGAMEDAYGYSAIVASQDFLDLLPANAISGDGLPSLAPDPADFLVSQLSLFGRGPGAFDFFGILASHPRIAQTVVVSEPLSLALFGAALAGLGLVGWLRRWPARGAA